MSLVLLALLACSPTDDGVPALPPPGAGEGFQISEGAFALDGYAEGLYCAHHPIPVEYHSGALYVTGVASLLPDATHHFFAGYEQTPAFATTPCDPEGPLVTGAGFEEEGAHADFGGKMIFGSGVGAYEYWMPPGYGTHLPSGLGRITGSHHVYNFNEEPVDLYGVVNVYTSPPEDIHHPVGILNCLLTDIHVPPHATAKVSATCTVPFDLDLVVLSSHAHHYLQSFEARFYDGAQTAEEPFYVSDVWDAPVIDVFEEPMALLAGQGITFTCTYDNRTDQEVVYGLGEHGEMCASMNGYAYPSDRPHEIPVPLGTILLVEGSVGEVFDTSELDGRF